MKIYVIIDTNVIISALLSRNPDSATVKIMEHLYDRTIVPVYNDEILEEYSAVLRRPKFNFTESQINSTLEAIVKGGISSERIKTNDQLPDPKDVVFYEVSLSVDGSYLVTGNAKHFPKKSFVVTPAEMCRMIQEIKSPRSGLLSESTPRYGNR